ncbi:MAG TPA: FtsX-like permease family protein [Candidatus Saccharimonadales bacterium]|nr:FtsX-like permease family protein [Candidatus Saccharimonadales bacterium]
MSVVVRGAKNAFRNWLRTGAVVLILAIGIGLALSMLVAKQAVEARISDLQAQVGTTLLVNPAGSKDMMGGGEPLKTTDVDAIKSVAHVTSADAMVNLALQTEGAETDGIRMRGGEEPGKTNLKSSIDAGTLGKRFSGTANSAGEVPATISLPIRALGTNANRVEDGTALKITEGRALAADDTLSALVGKDLAEKNSLKIGSTFTAYGQTFAVVGIFDQGTKFANDMIVLPLAKAQELSGQASEVGSIVVTVDSIENLEATQTAIKDKLGSDKADITSTQQNIQEAIGALKSVQQVSLIGFIAAVAAASVITFLIMLVIVRERKREIGVLKAIGGSNHTIVSQFIVEAIVLVAMGTVVGLGVAMVSSTGIANALVSNSTNESDSTDAGPRSGAGPGPRMIKLSANGNSIENATKLVSDVTASVGPMTLVWGALAALVIAVVGSAVPAWLIAKVRPAEVMRGE